jgi:hypothetical protein
MYKYANIKFTEEELFREAQKPHLLTILNTISWEKLNQRGNSLITKDNGKTKENKFLKFYFVGDFDVLDSECIKKGCHSESIHYLPSYMISGVYGDFITGLIQGKKFDRHTGYKGLDFVYPKSIEIDIMARVGNLNFDEKAVLFDIDHPIDPIENSQKELYKQVNQIIIENELPLEARIFNDVEHKCAQVRLYSKNKEIKEPVFMLTFKVISSLEIVMADGFQVDSRKLL